MKAILAATLAASALVTAAPALAQPPMDRPMAGAGWDIDRRIGWLQERITRGVADGSLDRREQFRIQRQLDSIRRDEMRMRRMHHGRLWDNDRVMLESRLNELSDHIRWARNNPDFRRPW